MEYLDPVPYIFLDGFGENICAPRHGKPVCPKGVWMIWRGREKTRRVKTPTPEVGPHRTHVIIIDGTMSSLDAGYETNAGLTYRLLSTAGSDPTMTLFYEAGIQWRGMRKAVDVMAGIGINGQIRRAYGHLAANYQPGDRIFLFGYSRGAYAVRSLAGVIDMLGLLRWSSATERNVRRIWRYYQNDPCTPEARAFADKHCMGDSVRITMIGVWDTVKALGLHWPLLWRLSPAPTEFHHDEIGACVDYGFHALAIDETRMAFAPVLWACPRDKPAKVVQTWFRGTHGDIGGHLGDFFAARPLSNIPLVWILDQAEALGLNLPTGWRSRFPGDASAPMVGSFRSYAKLFVYRRRRRIGLDPSESVHPSVLPMLSTRSPAYDLARRQYGLAPAKRNVRPAAMAKG